MKNLIMFPLKKELDPFLNHLQSRGFKVEDCKSSNNHSYYSVPQLNAVCAKGGHGKVQHGILTQQYYSEVSGVESIFCVGAGGGLFTEVQVLDIVVGNKTIEHDFTVRFEKNHPAPYFESSPQWLDKTQTLNLKALSAHIGPIASGDEDIVDPHRAAELYEQTKALAVAWEGAGSARVAAFHKTSFLEIRAITDNARDDVANNFIKNLKPAMSNAAEYMIQLLQ